MLRSIIFILFIGCFIHSYECEDVTTIPVYITTSLLDVRTMDDKEAAFEAEVEWILEWETRYSNNGALWFPRLISDNKVKTQLAQQDSILQFVNTTKMILRERSQWAFKFDFKKFPFDTQEPRISLQPEISSNVVVVLIPSNIDSSSDKILRNSDKFHIEGWRNFHDASVEQQTSRSITGYPIYGYELKFKTSREYGSYLVQNIFPAAIFVFVSFAGFWMDFTSLMPRLMPILFSTVALANLNTSTSTFITRGGSVSFFEAFALYSTIVSATVLVELVIVHNLARRKLREEALLVDKICRYAFPYLYFVGFFFLVLLLAVDAPLWGSLLFLFGGLLIFVIGVILYSILRIGYWFGYKKNKKSKKQDKSTEMKQVD